MKSLLVLFFAAIWALFFYERAKPILSPSMTGSIYIHGSSPDQPIVEKTDPFNVTQQDIYESTATIQRVDHIPIVLPEAQVDQQQKHLTKTFRKNKATVALPKINNSTPLALVSVATPIVNAEPVKTDSPSVAEKPGNKSDEFFILNKAVNESMSSFFFNNAKSSINNVSVEVASLTPYQSQDIIKFRVINSQPEFFFIQGVYLYEKERMVNAKTFFDRFVPAKKTLDCLALVPRRSNTKITLTLQESGGLKRNFTIEVKIP